MKNKQKIDSHDGKMYQTLNKIVQSTYENLIEHTLVKVHDCYVLYNQYVIKKNNDVFWVSRRRDGEIFKFNSKKLALIWSVLDYNRRIYESSRIRMLDSLIVSLLIEQQIHERMHEQNWTLYSIKIQQNKIRMKKYNTEINKYIRLANTLQNKELQK
jgi:hypothetical protein